VRGTWRGCSFTGDPEGYVEESSGDGHLSPMGPRLGTGKGDHLPGSLRDGWRVSTGTASLPLRELRDGNLVGVLLYWGPWRVCKGRLWRRASLSTGAPLGNLKGDSYTGDFER
jgi:hypothetical protein